MWCDGESEGLPSRLDGASSHVFLAFASLPDRCVTALAPDKRNPSNTCHVRGESPHGTAGTHHQYLQTRPSPFVSGTAPALPRPPALCRLSRPVLALGSKQTRPRPQPTFPLFGPLTRVRRQGHAARRAALLGNSLHGRRKYRHMSEGGEAGGRGRGRGRSAALRVDLARTHVLTRTRT